jgi:hypothetical protein
VFGRGPKHIIGFMRGDIAVLYHLPFGEKNDLPSAQYLRCEKGEQAGVIIGHRTAAPQQPGEMLAAEKQFVRRHTAAIRSRRLVNEILRNDRFEAREMVKKENLALFDVAIGIMHLDIDPEATAQHGKRAHAPLIQNFIDLELWVAAHDNHILFPDRMMISLASVIPR